MKKLLQAVLVAILLVQSAGCASVQKKFTRKKKIPAHIPSAIYLDSGPYQKKYSNEYYYKTHFTLWKTWHYDLLNQLGGNNKKVSRCAQEALGHLKEVNRYLVPDKQAELKDALGSMEQLSQTIQNGSGSSTNEGSMRVELSRIGRAVENNFYYDKVRDFILPDQVDLGSGDAAPEKTLE